jgi:CheY-like chemotaxis protein
VLVVDDNADAADSIALLLQLSGHQTKVVYGGEEGIAACHEYRPDVILLDIGLPGMDGYQVIEALRAAGFRGHAIALSGYGQPEDTRKALQSGFDAHLVKPVEIETLERALAVPD